MNKKQTALRYRLELVREETLTYQAENSLSSPAVLEKMLRTIGIDKDIQENLLTLYLDSRNRVVAYEKIARGGQTACQVHPMDVFRGAIIAGAARIIVAHNHPSGDTSPSDSDLKTAQSLKEAGELLGCELLDFVIIGDKFRSFKDTGQII